METLNQKEEHLFTYIRKRVSEGLSPTVREICTDMGIKSTSSAHKLLKQLVEKGYINMGAGANRSIQVVGTGGTTNVPLLGTVAAGIPIFATQQIVEYIPFKEAGGKELFALNVRGESMIEDAILDGDIVIVQSTPVVNNGEIAVALIEDEATVKRFYKEKGHFRLQPANSSMAPIIVDEVVILGRVIAVIRHY